MVQVVFGLLITGLGADVRWIPRATISRLVRDVSLDNRIVFEFCFLRILLGHAHAQSTATLHGRVLDPSGAFLPGVKITIHHRATGLGRVAFNHANFGQPGNVVGRPTFGRITNTRFQTGESGSSRQCSSL
jgi:hypothetical protein